MLLQITYDTILQFLQMNWFLIIFLGGMIWKLVLMNFKQKDHEREIRAIKTSEIARVNSGVEDLKKHMDAHDRADKVIEQNLSSLIDRNKELSAHANSMLRSDMDRSTNMVQTQLSAISTSVALVNQNLKLIMEGKIKIVVS